MSPGTGAQPAHEYLPNVPPWTVLQGFAQDTGDQYLGPNYVGIQQPTGQLFFGPYNPHNQAVTAAYTGIDFSGLSITNSIADLRSAINLQTINPWTYELDTAHIDMPMSVKARIGWNRDWLERQARFGVNLLETAYNAERVAGLNSQAISGRLNILNPYMHVGNRINLSNCRGLSSSQDFYTIHVHSALGSRNPLTQSGGVDCYQNIVARNVASF